MSDWVLNTPVIFLVFNRPDTTQEVFEAIRQAQPPRLFIVADGPRATHSADEQKCAAVREIVAQVDWACEVQHNYSAENLGCKRRVSSGLKWAFEQVEEAIILEDDCLPHPTFFRFMQELLEKYRHDDRIGAISGDDFQITRHTSEYSYYFSKYFFMWGWATWRRSVEFFDPNMPSWPKVSADGLLETIFETPTEVQYWKSVFDRVHQGKLDSWGYGWFFSSLIQNQFNIMPVGNLVSNIGYVQNATHTQDTTSHLSNLSVTAAKFPLRHPLVVSHHQKFDKLIKEDVYHIGRPFLKRLFQKLNRIFRQYQPKLG